MPSDGNGTVIEIPELIVTEPDVSVQVEERFDDTVDGHDAACDVATHWTNRTPAITSGGMIDVPNRIGPVTALETCLILFPCSAVRNLPW